MVNRYRGASAVASALIVMLLPACTTTTETAGLRPHPPDTGTLTSTFELEPGDIFSEGMVQVFPQGDETIEIVDVRSNDIEGDLEYLGAYVAGIDRPVNNQIVHSFPPDDPEVGPVEPAVGARIDPVPPELSEAGVQILLGYRVGESARSVRGSVSIDYRVDGGRVRTQEEEVAVVVCTDPGDDECLEYDPFQ